MARADTTHVIEIESGIGEPAFIPLTRGQELSPISVGKKGMWRIESARVLDVHAFVYFDGASLFLQSADEHTSALVEGQPVGKQWTELSPPCRIEIGQARLRFRSLLQEDEEQTSTFAMPAPPLHHVEVEAAGGAPLGLYPATPSAAQGIPAKPERPFAPGEFVARLDDATRVAPVENTKAGNRRGHLDGPRPAAGVPPTGPSPSGMAVPATGHSASYPGAHGSMHPGMPMQPAPGVYSPGNPPIAHGGMMPSASMHPGAMMQPGMGPPPPMGPHGMAPSNMQGVPPTPVSQHGGTAYGSGAYPGQGSQPPLHPAGQPGPNGYGPPSGQVPTGYPPQSLPPGSQVPNTQQPTNAGGQKDFATRWKEMPALRRLLVLFSPLFLASAYYTLVVDDAPPPRTTRVVSDAGALGSATTRTTNGGPATSSPTTPTAEAFVDAALPPGLVAPPINTPDPMATDAGAAAAFNNPDLIVAPTSERLGAHPHGLPPVSTHAGRDGGAATDHRRTLERAAVDAYLAGDYAGAARNYERLADQTRPPSNIVYLEAARIIRAELDAGAR